MPDPIALLLTVIDQAYDRKSWHGTNLRGSIRGLTPQQAVWRPQPARHNIHELGVHAAYWKYAARRRLSQGKRGAFPLAGSNFFARETADAPQWKSDVALLEQMHRQLRATISTLPAAALPKPLRNSDLTHAALITGIAAHDLYHAGQIQLIKALARRS